MDIDGPSSPLQRQSSLPPSSAPQPSLGASTAGVRTPSRANGHDSRMANGNANPVDALALDDINPDVAGDAELENTQRRRRARVRGNIEGNVPLVRDALGEQITDSFETFLKT